MSISDEQKSRRGKRKYSAELYMYFLRAVALCNGRACGRPGLLFISSFFYLPWFSSSVYFLTLREARTKLSVTLGRRHGVEYVRRSLFRGL